MIGPILTVLLMTGEPKVSTRDLIKSSWQHTQVIAHRGASAYKPENTLPAFEEAIASNALATECDVHMSLDKVPVIMHDDSLDRTTKLKGKIALTDSKTMREAGVPTLDELTTLTRNRIVLVIEVKGGEGVDEAVVKDIRSKKMDDQVIIFSFDRGHVKKVKELNKKLFGVWLVGEKYEPAKFDDMFKAMKDSKADALGFWYPVVTPELVAEAHRRHVPVFVWTVAPGAEVDRLVGLKVNFIITNHPREVLAQVNKN